jgi:hypothetical protein
MLAKMKLEEDSAAQNMQQEEPQQNSDNTSRTTNTQLHQQGSNPIKRKFLKSQEVIQVINGSPSTTPNKITKASLANLASQDQ